MPFVTRLSLCAVGVTALIVAISLPVASARADELKHYDSNNKEFWLHPPEDWFMFDETEEQKGTAPANTMGPPTGMTDDEIAAALKNVKLAPGFKIDVYASGVNSARQMAWGDKGTLFVGSFGVGTVYAIVDEGGKKQVKAILKGLKMPTGVAFGTVRSTSLTSIRFTNTTMPRPISTSWAILRWSMTICHPTLPMVGSI